MVSKPVSLLAVTGLVALSGCIDPKDYETTPVKVESPKGTVICQLYKERQVIWDEAVSIPPGMTIAEGDRICINEGLRRLKG